MSEGDRGRGSGFQSGVYKNLIIRHMTAFAINSPGGADINSALQFARLEPIFLANRWTAKQAAAVPTRPPSVDTATATEPASMADLKEAVSPRSRRRRSHSATLEIPNAEPSDAEADREDEGDDDDDDDGEDGINNSEPEDQFHFSEGNTPSNERAAPILSLGTSYLRRRDSALLGKSELNDI